MVAIGFFFGTIFCQIFRISASDIKLHVQQRTELIACKLIFRMKDIDLDELTRDNLLYSRVEGIIKHYHIKKNSDGLYFLAEKHPFSKIPDLIFYHKHNCAGMNNICLFVSFSHNSKVNFWKCCTSFVVYNTNLMQPLHILY